MLNISFETDHWTWSRQQRWDFFLYVFREVHKGSQIVFKFHLYKIISKYTTIIVVYLEIWGLTKKSLYINCTPTLLDDKTIREWRDLQHVQQGGLWCSHFFTLLDQMYIILNITDSRNISVLEQTNTFHFS